MTPDLSTPAPRARHRRPTVTAPAIGAGLALVVSTLAVPGAASAEPAGAGRPTTALVRSLAAGHAPASSAAQVTHVVRSGDTVSAIALRHGTTVRAIAHANNLASASHIVIGQRLVIPSGEGATSAPPRSPQPQPGRAPSGTVHVVARGDTVSALAVRYDVPARAIVAANALGPRATIRIGQRLQIPVAPSAPASRPASRSAAAPAATSRTHTVLAGQTLSGIAARYGTTVAAIAAANGITNPRLIRAGQRLRIPSGGASEPPIGNTFLGRTYSDSVVAAANANRRALLARDVPSKAEMQRLIRRVAQILGVDPALAQAVAYQESGFDQRAVSPANAVGAMQVIPSSGEWAETMVKRELDLLDPLDNATAGVAILRTLQRHTDDLPTAIASYYQGMASVKRNGMYPDTERYVANVLALRTRFS